MLQEKKVFIAAHNGMVGSAIKRRLSEHGYRHVLTAGRGELDLRDQRGVESYFDANRPQIIILAAARVGGIQANIMAPAEFLYDNLVIEANVIHAAWKFRAERVVFLSSSCVYPAACPQPMREEHMMTGPLEPTNEGYAMAKLAGMKLVQFYNSQYGMPGISLVPCNIYGTNDHFDLQRSHVLSALVRRFVDAVDNNCDNIQLWGTGIARRELMHVDDLADATLFLMERLPGDGGIINVGTGTDVSIRELAELIAHKAGFTGEIAWDATKPDGMLRKCLDISKISALGFSAHISLEDGVERTISEYSLLKSRGVVS